MKILDVAVSSMILVCGCVTQGDHEALRADYHALNERVARMENDLYKIEIKTAPREMSEKVEDKKFEPNKDVEVSVIDIKTETFLKEYVGVSFGDDISSVKDDKESNDRYSRNVKMLKPFKYFDKAYLSFTDGKLTYIQIQASIEKKFSRDSVMKRFKEACDDLSVTLGYQADFSLPVRLRRENKRPAVSVVYRDSSTSSDKYLLSISFANTGLRDALIKARNKSGEELPEVK